MGCIIQLLLIDALSPRRLSMPRLLFNENKHLETRRALSYYYRNRGPLCGGPLYYDSGAKAPKAFPRKFATVGNFGGAAS
ncbi:hypothetical protein ABIE78_001976 [Sinorhizobium fredii]